MSPVKQLYIFLLGLTGVSLLIFGLYFFFPTPNLTPIERVSRRPGVSPTGGTRSPIKLIDYAVRVLNPEEAAAARVRVFITSSDGQKSWETVGVSENIVEASWQALVDAMEYYYNESLDNGDLKNGKC